LRAYINIPYSTEKALKKATKDHRNREHHVYFKEPTDIRLMSS
jgi:hypothetical protein